MRRSRFQFTIRQLLAIVGLTAVLCSLFVDFHWPIELAIACVPLGYLVERMRGESGIMSAMMAGALGFIAYGLMRFAEDSAHSPSAFFGDGPVPYVTLFGCLGFAFGTMFGLGACELLALFGRFRAMLRSARTARQAGPGGR